MTAMTNYEYLNKYYGETAQGSWTPGYLDGINPITMPKVQYTHWNPLRKADQLFDLCRGRARELREMEPEEFLVLSFELDKEVSSDYALASELPDVRTIHVPHYPMGMGKACQAVGKATRQLNILVSKSRGIGYFIVSAYYGDAFYPTENDLYIRCLGEPIIKEG